MRADVPHDSRQGQKSGNLLEIMQDADERQEKMRQVAEDSSRAGLQRGNQALYDAVCGICHAAAHRATMVPDLRHLNHPAGAEHWKTWITHGRTGSLMPAFAASEGGPLSAGQIEALVKYLEQTISATNH